MTNPKLAFATSPPKVADYLKVQIDHIVKSGEKTQRQIAIECGYDGARSNIISMFKQGLTRLPVNKVGPMAKSLGVDAVHLLRLVLGEYNPETWEVLNAMMGNRLISKGEQVFLDRIRAKAGDIDVYPETKDEVKALDALVVAIADRKHSELHRAATKVIK